MINNKSNKYYVQELKIFIKTYTIIYSMFLKIFVKSFISIFIFFPSFYSYGEGKFQPYNLVSLENYLLKLNGAFFFKPQKDFEQIKYFYLLESNIVQRKVLFFILEMFHLICYNKIKNLNKKFIYNYQLILTQVNYLGFEELLEDIKKNIKNIERIRYIIVPLDRNENIQKIENILSKGKISLEILSNHFNFLPVNINTKDINLNCPYCTKKEIASTLNNMEINDVNIIYLKSLDRYVIIQCLEKKTPDKDYTSLIKNIYLIYGVSLLNHNKKAQRQYMYRIFHHIFCK